jgi:NAD-dependent SIR2 family protein deacetylase
MIMTSCSLDETLAPAREVSICIPPVLRTEADKVVAELPSVHPAWRKLEQRGRHYVLRTSSIDDLEELADWACSWLSEPMEPLGKAKRQAFQTVINRTGRYVHLRAIGSCHYLASGWK